jgi:hypothetical protein
MQGGDYFCWGALTASLLVIIFIPVLARSELKVLKGLVCAIAELWMFGGVAQSEYCHDRFE